VLGELVQTTTGKWITHPPTRCPSGHTLGPGQVPYPQSAIVWPRLSVDNPSRIRHRARARRSRTGIARMARRAMDRTEEALCLCREGASTASRIVCAVPSPSNVVQRSR
jgi:hypothetical protein